MSLTTSLLLTNKFELCTNKLSILVYVQNLYFINQFLKHNLTNKLCISHYPKIETWHEHYTPIYTLIRIQPKSEKYKDSYHKITQIRGNGWWFYNCIGPAL